MADFILLIGCLLICFYCVYIAIQSDKENKNKEDNNIEQETVKQKNNIDNYVKPTFKKLNQEQIDDIHSRNKITPAEMVKEWEDMDLCAPGDAIGSASWRCRKFHHNCHDCLVDYANEHDEYTSFFEIMKLCNPYRLREENGEITNEERNTTNS